MPDWIPKFMSDVGMPWSCVAAFFWVHYRVLVEILTTLKQVAKTLDHIAQHILGKEHKHDE